MKVPRFTCAQICSAWLSLLLAASPALPQAALAAPSENPAFTSETVHVTTDATGNVTAIKIGDVPYEGTNPANPPVEVRVSYTLDGASVSPQELAGATGHLAIRVDYKNTSAKMRAINGKDELIYTPFVCLTVALLDGEVFRNVTVENGRSVDDKGGIAVIGYAAPGLRESLALDKDIDLEIPEYLQIEADVTDLTLDPLYTIVTPELFGELDTSGLDLSGIDELDEGADALRDAAAQLVNGSGTLAEGLAQLADGSDRLGDGARSLREALNPLPQGLGQLKSGAQSLGDRLQDASGIAGGLSSGAGNIEKGTSGAHQLIDAAQTDINTASALVGDLKQQINASTFADARSAISSAQTSANAASNAASQAKDLVQGVASGVETQRNTAAGNVEAAKSALDALLDNDTTLTPGQRSALEGVSQKLGTAHTSVTAIDATPPAGLDAQAKALTDASAALASDAARIGVSDATLSELAKDADGALAALGSASTEASSAATTIDAAGQGARGIAAGANALAAGLQTASAGASDLATGIGKVAEAAPQALAGVNALVQGSDTLTVALGAAADGSTQLADGMATFNDEGVSKLASALESLGSDLAGTSDRLDVLREAAADYRSFASEASSPDATVRFIYKTERIG